MVTQGGRLLIVDDEPGIRRSLARLLAHHGYEVTAVGDGREAIAAVAAGGGFDVILSDIRMPDIDGLELLRAIRAADLDVPVVFMTGSPTLDSAIQGVEHGAFRYLLKPLATPDLLDVLARAVRWHRFARIRRSAAQEVYGRQVSDRAGLHTRFGAAMEQLWVAMQPIVSWGSRHCFAYEALVRTDEPTLRSPPDLLDAAERLDRVFEVGRAVRGRVAAALRDSDHAVQVFVNLHAADLQDPELLDDAGVLTAFASRVVLEVTERAAPDHIPHLQDRIARLRELGYRIAVDDLGAGYAGLSSFAHLEPDVVKVDMALVRGMESSAVKQKLFRSLTTLCSELDIRLVAEGIETEAERDAAAALGGDLFQGYLFCRPERGFPSPRY